ncbi:MAG: cysteine hydrolase family protein [Candidatus Pacearchaeota archaeon]
MIITRDAEEMAMLIVDMQDYFLHGIREKERIIGSHIETLRACRERGIPVIVMEYECWGKTNERIRKEIDQSKDPEYLVKNRNDAFTEKGLITALKIQGIRRLLITGVHSSICVKDTAKGALREGFTFSTAGTLLADRLDDDDIRAKEWYKINGVYVSDHKDLFKL